MCPVSTSILSVCLFDCPKVSRYTYHRLKRIEYLTFTRLFGHRDPWMFTIPPPTICAVKRRYCTWLRSSTLSVRLLFPFMWRIHYSDFQFPLFPSKISSTPTSSVLARILLRPYIRSMPIERTAYVLNCLVSLSPRTINNYLATPDHFTIIRIHWMHFLFWHVDMFKKSVCACLLRFGSIENISSPRMAVFSVYLLT